MKVSELEGAELDYWVAKAVGHRLGTYTQAEFTRYFWTEYMPSMYWSQGGPVIDRECLDVWFVDRHQGWRSAPAHAPTAKWLPGPTPLIAAMRCLVASKFGETVPETATASSE